MGDSRRSRPERFLRGLAQRDLQCSRRYLENVTAMDHDHDCD
jgi:hypothetical protein